MLRIQSVCLVVLRDVKVWARAIAQSDRDHARQLRRSGLSVHLNLAEGDGARGGTRRQRYFDALGSARETLANLEAAEALGYIEPMSDEQRNRFDHIIGTLVKLM